MVYFNITYIHQVDVAEPLPNKISRNDITLCAKTLQSDKKLFTFLIEESI